ncbi:hypothetical protein [Streptomyces sp. NRRL F-5135]|uniref:hypothetical protein n=1 Tax=Streptomyces sp. NRRL F-5135 TaxID=1463858 RepID=UPI000AD413A9|nr:hypothetical protein [Streptomyces sp. NRRL F-5135]
MPNLAQNHTVVVPDLRGGFEHYRTLLDDGRENRAPLAERKLPMPVLAVGTTHSGHRHRPGPRPPTPATSRARSPRPGTSSPRKTPTGSPRR